MTELPSFNSINRAYRRLQRKLDELNIPYSVLKDSLNISVPIDKLSLVTEILEKENKYMDYNIKG